MEMKKIIFVGLLSLILTQCTPPQSDADKQPVAELIGRIMPEHSDEFVLKNMPSENGQDVFELSSEDDYIIIKASSNSAAARALNYYLNTYCKTRISWYKDDPVEIPQVLPKVPEKVRQICRFEKRFFLNYCTFGYTTLWWKWDDWQRFIDWMSLNSINMPLAITGQEYIWEQVWTKFGLTEEQVRTYFTGPAHLPWHRMGNLDGWLGPLPQEFIDDQFELQKKILKRERELGMKPILPAFAGHVPKAIKEANPDSKIISLGSYGVGDEYNAYFLDPKDPLFKKIQVEFLKEQEANFGTDHYYGADPFNEMDPPSWETDYLASVSKSIYDGMQEVDPNAVWVQMGWTFFYDRKNWTNERLDGMIHAVPDDKMVILDYFCENTEVWKTTDSYFNAPYVWCYLGNFGGNTEMAGPLKKIAERIVISEDDSAHGKMFGIGSTLEGFGVNSFVFEWLFDYAWDKDAADLPKWAKKYTASKCGQDDNAAAEAWTKMIDLVYDQQNSGVGMSNIMLARPILKGTKGYNYQNKYDYLAFADIWEKLLNVNSSSMETYRYQSDLVMVTKQALNNLALYVRAKIADAYYNKDITGFNKNVKIFLEMFDDVDMVLKTRSSFLGGKWCEDARDFGKDAESKKYYEKDAWVLLTTWGGQGNGITDYASRDLQGMLTSYYKGRWEIFFKKISNNLGSEINYEEFNKEIEVFEWEWSEKENKFDSVPSGNVLEITKNLYDKYKPLYESQKETVVR